MWANRRFFMDQTLTGVIPPILMLGKNELTRVASELASSSSVLSSEVAFQELQGVISFALTHHPGTPTLGEHRPDTEGGHKEQVQKAISEHRDVLKRFGQSFADLVMSRGSQISQEGSYHELAELYDACMDIHTGVGSVSVLRLLVQYVQHVHLYQGSESKLLVGARDDHPVFLPLKRYLDTPEAWEPVQENLAVLMQDGLRCLRPQDIDLVPQPEEYLDLLSSSEFPEVPEGAVRQVLEQAFFERRYLLGPEGAYVRLYGHDRLTGITIKEVWPSTTDPNYCDFIACFEMGSKRFMHFIEGGRLSGKVLRATEPTEYLDLLIAVVFRDLVTARVVPEVESLDEVHPRSRKLREADVGGEAVRWVYIPRVVRGRKKALRVAYEGQRHIKPHPIVPHVRKRPITDGHRQSLEEFEREYEVSILKWLPEGYTFVRPGFSPPRSGEDLQRLPGFIRAEVQEAMEAAMQTAVSSLDIPVLAPTE